MDLSMPPPPPRPPRIDGPEEQLATRRSIRAMQPKWKQFLGWLGEFQKFAVTLISVATVSIAVHVWLKGLITRKELEVAVDASVRSAVVAVLTDVQVDVDLLKTRTGGLPEWRAEVTIKLVNLEAKMGTVEKKGEKNEDRIDRYIVVSRGGR